MSTINLPVPVTAEQHRPATTDEEPELTGWCYNEHKNQLGDWCPWSEKPAPEDSDEGDPCPAGCPRGEVVEACRTCGVPNDDGEGWDGECGNCADATEGKRNHIDVTALQVKIAAAGHVALVDNTGGNTATLYAGRLAAGDEDRPCWSVAAGPGYFEEGRAAAHRDEFGYGHDVWPDIDAEDEVPWVNLYDDTRDLDAIAAAIVRMIEEVEQQRAKDGVASASRDAIVTAYGKAVADAQERVYGKPPAAEPQEVDLGPAVLEGEVWGRITLGIENDDSDTWWAVYNPRNRWNGFVCPRFRRQEAEQMRVYLDAVIAKYGPDAVSETLRWDGDVLVVVSGQHNAAGYERQPGEQPWEDRLEPDERGLYPIGSHGWCWHEANPAAVVRAELAGGAA